MIDNFPEFAKAVHKRYDEMARGELFVTEPLDIFESYLAAFPEGTNPVFRERTEHDCTCCKNFIKNLGPLVSIDGGEVSSIWDIPNLPYPYDVVAARLGDLVRQSEITKVYRTSERQYGTDHNYEKKTNRRWDHLVGKVGKLHHSATPDKARGDIGTLAGVLRRGLDEMTADAFSTVLDLIDTNAIYRGAEFKGAVKAFQKLVTGYAAAANKNLFVWANVGDKIAGFRNTAIGTLLSDLSTGVDITVAVAKFESKVAPENYKRSSALITPKMIDDATATLASLDLEGAIDRRMANITDVSVEDVLFVDSAERGKMRGGIAGLLMEAVKPEPVDIKHTVPIGVEEFLTTILPQATSIDVLVENAHLANFVTLTAPARADTGKLFRWDNDFAWMYDGDVGDSMRQKVVERGGRVDGVLRFTHQWNDVGRNASLMDLHVFMPGSSKHTDGHHNRYPSGPRVGWNQRTDYKSGGRQDVDYTEAAPVGYVPVENITFPELRKLSEGAYTFAIHNWSLRQPTTSGFKAEIAFGGEVYEYDHPAPLGQKEWITLAVATLKNGVFTIEHHHPTTTSSKKKWGIDTQTLVPVETMMLSPNYWGENRVGNKHLFFFLKGCKNPDEVRGFLNEYLRPEFEAHRKVFEVLGSKTKAPSVPDQLSGVGFSSTGGGSITAVVKGKKINRAYTINF